MSETYRWSELQHHNKTDDLFVVIRGDVYDVTGFQHEHPGGPEFLLDQGGGDVTELFEDAGHSDEARFLMTKFKIGVVEGKANNKRDMAVKQGGNGSFVGVELPRHTLPLFFFLFIGFLYNYYYQKLTKILPTWQGLLPAPN